MHRVKSYMVRYECRDKVVSVVIGIVLAVDQGKLIRCTCAHEICGVQLAKQVLIRQALLLRQSPLLIKGSPFKNLIN